MQVLDWAISSISSSALVLAALWLGRSLISTRLKSSVEHQFNEKLEAVRADARMAEERFRADLKAKEGQIAALRDGVLSAAASRQIAVDKRRLEAIEQLWEAFCLVGQYRSYLQYVDRIHYGEALKESETNKNLRDFAKVLVSHGKKLEDFDAGDAHKARPFVTPIAWSLFSAYQALLLDAVLRLKLIETGLNQPRLIKTDTVRKMLKLALPDFADLIDKTEVFSPYMEALEESLLAEFRRMMAGQQADQESLARAASITKAAESIHAAAVAAGK